MTQAGALLRKVNSKHAQGIVQIAAGLALAAFPAIYLATYARIAPIERQGFLALSLAIGAFVSATLCAFVIESRLATPDADHTVSLPRWMTVACVVSAAVLILGPPVPPSPILMIGVVGLMSGLLMSRSVGVVSGRWKLEATAAGVLLVACAVALLLAQHHNGNSVRVLVLGALLAILVRLWRVPRGHDSGMPPDLPRAAWVTGETAVVGIVQPILTSIILVMLGPAASVSFRVISTVANALEPILTYGRIRLLAHGHKGEVALVVATFAAGVAIIFGAEYLNVWRLVFGPAWKNVGMVALLLACLWKGLMLMSTLPFAALRRAGQTILVFWIRCSGTLIYLLFGVTFVLAFRTETAVFGSFVIAEVFGMAMYYYGARRTTWKKPGQKPG